MFVGKNVEDKKIVYSEAEKSLARLELKENKKMIIFKVLIIILIVVINIYPTDGKTLDFFSQRGDFLWIVIIIIQIAEIIRLVRKNREYKRNL